MRHSTQLLRRADGRLPNPLNQLPTSLCLEPTCKQPATYRGRCPAHARQQDKQTNRAGRHIYNTKRWQVLRRAFLFNHPLCAEPGCEQIATDVHHLVDLADGGDPYDPENLEQLCHHHHSRKTRARQQAA